MIIEYRGTEVEVTPATVKAWAQSKSPDESIGVTNDGEMCLIASYIVEHLPFDDYAISVDHQQIRFDRLMKDHTFIIGDEKVAPDHAIETMIHAFDWMGDNEIEREVNAAEVLTAFEKRNIW